MSRYRNMIVLALATAACQRGGGTTNPEPSGTTATPMATALSVPRSSPPEAVPEVAPVPSPASDECAPAERIAPATLAASWPARIGSRVRFKGRVEVAVDVMDAVVTAAGHRFLVVAGPDQLWEGDKERTFSVMGSKTVSLGGRTTLPQLLLEPECPP
jgi:hypothetical protein